jgi:hypothetical protein
MRVSGWWAWQGIWVVQILTYKAHADKRYKVASMYSV